MSIFVDTGAWFASVVPADRHHLKVVAFLQQNPLPLITTDYVIDETLTLLRARWEMSKAIGLGRHGRATHSPCTLSGPAFQRIWSDRRLGINPGEITSSFHDGRTVYSFP